MTEDQDLLEVYMARGLTAPFAKAIISGKLEPEEVMKFWLIDWHKQYPESDDVLIQAVLDGTLSPEDGEWLNSVRSNHEQLIHACIADACTVDWAKALIEAGFMDHPDLVTDILKGAEPLVIAQLSGMETSEVKFPPKLPKKWLVETSDVKPKHRKTPPTPSTKVPRKAKLRAPSSVKDMPWFGDGNGIQRVKDGNGIAVLCFSCDEPPDYLCHSCCGQDIRWKKVHLNERQVKVFSNLCVQLSFPINNSNTFQDRLDKVQQIHRGIVSMSGFSDERIAYDRPGEELEQAFANRLEDAKITMMEELTGKRHFEGIYDELGIQFYPTRTKRQSRTVLLDVVRLIEDWRQY